MVVMYAVIVATVVVMYAVIVTTLVVKLVVIVAISAIVCISRCHV